MSPDELGRRVWELRGPLMRLACAIVRRQQDAEDALLERLLHQAQAAANDFCRTDFDADAPEPVRLAVLRRRRVSA